MGQLLWEAAKANLIEGATLGLRKKWTVMLDAGRGLKRAWESGDWAGFFDTAVDIFNQNYNPLYAAGEHGYYAYNSKKAHDWRGTFRHGTIAVIIGVLTVVTTAKGVAGAAKKGTGAVGIGAAEEAGTKAAVPPKASTHNNRLDTPKPAHGYTLRDRKTGEVLKYGETTLGKRRYSQSELKKGDLEMKFETSGTKREMHDWQHNKILEYKANNGGKRPPLNKSDW